MTYPKISVITPNYNQEKFLEQTILSVLLQNYPNLEYIIIDGGSTDRSIDIIKKYESKLHYWISEPDDGMYDAINKGFSVSSGEIMTYINSDDLLQPYSLFTVASVFSQYPFIKWVNGIPNIIDENNRIILVGEIPKWTKFHFLAGNYKYIQQEGTFWTRELWNMSGAKLSTSLKLAGDMELWSRFFNHTQLYYLPVLLGSFRRRRSGQKSLEQIDEYHKEADEVIKSYICTTSMERKIIRKYYSLMARILYRINKKKLYYLLGYKDIYEIFREKKVFFGFDRNTQDFYYTEGND